VDLLWELEPATAAKHRLYPVASFLHEKQAYASPASTGRRHRKIKPAGRRQCQVHTTAPPSTILGIETAPQSPSVWVHISWSSFRPTLGVGKWQFLQRLVAARACYLGYRKYCHFVTSSRRAISVWRYVVGELPIATMDLKEFGSYQRHFMIDRPGCGGEKVLGEHVESFGEQVLREMARGGTSRMTFA
jgi:hypothetical protein